MRDTESWMREAGARRMFDNASIMASIESVRRKGFLAGPHPSCRSTEIFAHAVTGAPHAVALHIPTCLSRDSKDDVRRIMEMRVKEYEAGQGRLPVPVPAMQPAHAARWPAGRAQDFSARFAMGARDAVMLASQRDAG
jgi:hypothetical protein